MQIHRTSMAAILLAIPLWGGLLWGGLWSGPWPSPWSSPGSSDPPKVRPREAASYDARDSHDGITVVAEAYDSDEKIKTAFGNHDPRKFGILPVYVVFFNTSKDALRLDALEVTLQRGRTQFAQLPAVEVSRRVNGFQAPNGIKPPKFKNPISSIVDQEFLLTMVPPGETAGGFLYFDRFTGRLSVGQDDTRLYLNKIQWAASGRELLYFEIAFPDSSKDTSRDTSTPTSTETSKDTRKP